MLLFLINLAVAAYLMVKVMQTKVSRERGTNTVTRFIRDGAGHMQNNMYIGIAGATTLFCLVIGAIFKCAWSCLPTIAVIIFIFVQQFKSNKSEQRVKDSRVVTKGTGKVVAATGTAVAATACAASGVGIPATAAIVAGAAGATRVVDKSVNEMTDVSGPDINREDFKELNTVASKLRGIDIEHPEAFIEAANRAGIETSGKDLGEVASNVIKFAPPAMLAELPDGISDEEKAMRIMGGNVG